MRFTNVTFSSNNFTFSLASGTSLSEKIVISTSQINSSLDSSLTSTLSACYNIIRIFSTCSFTMRAGNLFFDHNIKLLSKIKIFEFQKNFNFKFRSFHSIYVHLMMKIGVVHFLFSNSVIKILFVGFI